MKKALLISGCILVFITQANADTFNTIHRHPSFGKNIIRTAPTYTSNHSNLNLMEQALFNQNYNRENINSRLNRLEENMFGEAQNGTVGERYRNLSQAFDFNRPNPYYRQNQHYYNNYNNPYPMFSPYSPETSRKLGLLNRLSRFLGGTQTGITPSMDGFLEDGMTSSPYGNGYYTHNRHLGNGTSVRILD